MKSITEYLLADPMLAPAFKRGLAWSEQQRSKHADKGTVAEAFQAQDLLRAAVLWHQRNEEAELPTPLLAMLWAARRVC